jgi:hypothetical protein
MRSKRELELILDKYDRDHAKQGGLAGAALNLIASDIVEQLFPDLPVEDRAKLGDMLDRDLTGGGDGRWLRSLVTSANLVYALNTEA